MFCCENNSLHSCFLAYARPLTTIQLCRIKCFRRFTSHPPLHVRKCVHIEMNKCIKLQFMPCKLSFGWQRPNWIWRIDLFAPKNKYYDKNRYDCLHYIYFIQVYKFLKILLLKNLLKNQSEMIRR